MSHFMFGYTAASISGSNTSTANAAQSTATAAQRQVKHIEDRLDRLALINMALWSLIQDKTGLTEDDLLERVRLIDMMDGVEDGKVTRTASKCTKCDRVMNPRHEKCMYCGHAKLIQSAFDRL